ncbi:ATP-binding cassette domain-containing protein [Capillimicrobium parvum]|uniref:ATP-binding cassette domain-containing protein n=1 Tax=Capillimicrobium parvum TaxID=2884022 RepID=UPI00216B634C|nr:ATP-binding cassette domain-containing protein [Capillimicrobium parvum]
MLEVEGARKRYGATEVLKGVSFNVHRGEVVGLLGPNGAGKSTMIKTLTGVVDLDGGTIRFEGTPVKHLGAIPSVGVMHQDFGVIDEMTVLENMRLGVPALRSAGPLLSGKREREAVHRALGRVGLDVPLGALAASLSPAERAIMAVARLLDVGAQFLILDEATANLSHQDARRLADAILSGAGAAGTTVLLVTHKLSELTDWADRAIVMIDGVVVRDSHVKGHESEIVRALAPDVERSSPAPDSLHAGSSGDSGARADTLFELWGAGTERFGPLTLRLNRGEVIGLTGAASSGIHDIGLVAAGVRPLVYGERKVAPGIRVALLPGNRETEGSFDDLPVTQNMTLTALRRWRGPLGSMRLRQERRDARDMAARLRVVPANVSISQGALSGGNQQKVLFGRCLFEEADVLVMCDPTRGLDVRTRREMYARIGELKAKGVGVLVLSSDAEDILELCDSVAIVEDGHVGALEDVASLTVSELELMV